MAGVWVLGPTYDRMKEDADAYRKLTKEERQQGESAALTAYREGKKGQAVVLAGAANMPAIQSAVTGAAVMWLVNSDFVKRLPYIKQYPWARGVLIGALGYWLWRRGNPLGIPLMTIGGGVLAESLLAARAAKHADAKGAKGARDGKETHGPDDETGWWHGEWRERPWGSDPYGYEHARWVESPTGGHVLLTEGPATRAAERMADRIFDHARI